MKRAIVAAGILLTLLFWSSLGRSGDVDAKGTNGLNQELDVGLCSSNVVAVKAVDKEEAVPGETLMYDLQVRNDPAGACVGTSGLTASGNLVLQNDTSGGAGADASLSPCPDLDDPRDVCVTGILMWVEYHVNGEGPTWHVLPSLGNLTTRSTNKLPAACPGGLVEGCDPEAQANYGAVAFDTPPPFTVPCDPVDGICTAPAASVPFSFFVDLSASDSALIDECTSSKSAKGQCGGLRIVAHIDFFNSRDARNNFTRHELAISGADTTALDLVLHDRMPDGSEFDMPLGDLAPGAQLDLDDFASFDIPEGSQGDLVNAATVEYSDASGTAHTSAPSEARTLVIEPAVANPTIFLTADPAAITANTPTPVLASAWIKGSVDGPVDVAVTSSGATTIGGQLNDMGEDGDLVSGDSVYSGTVELDSPGPTLTLQAQTVVDGQPTASQELEVDVTSADIPNALGPSDLTQVIADPATGANVLSNELLVSFADEATFDDVRGAVAAIGGEIVGRIPEIGTWQIGISAVPDVGALNSVIEQLSQQPFVVGVEPNGLAEPSEVIPNDPRYGSQWGLKKIRADEAWVMNRGAILPQQTHTFIVAVVDTGVDYNHPDLAGKVIKGWDFVDNDNDPMDGGSHGTHVAGIISAWSDNGRGVASTSWWNWILAERVIGPTGGTDAWVAKGITHAVDRGAAVINLSLGGSGRSETVVKALSYANSGQRLVAAAAGNDKCQKKSYPGGFDTVETFTSWFGLSPRTYYTSVLTVGATNQSDRRAVWISGSPDCRSNAGSNYGWWVEMGAPGTAILSTVPGASYESKSGTSMATPFVSGAAALVFAAHPNWTEDQVRSRLMVTAHNIPGQGLGRGRLDVFSAVFNSGFETGTLAEWNSSGTAYVTRSLGPVKPKDGSDHMALISTGPSSPNVSASLVRSFNVLPGTDRLTIRLDYNYITEEYPEWVGSIFNDYFRAKIVTSSGAEIPLAFESVNTTSFIPITGIDFPGGDNTLGQSGWKTVSAVVPVTPGTDSISLFVTDQGDAIYDTVVVLDNIRFR
jgi:subtilisin family serine protease